MDGDSRTLISNRACLLASASLLIALAGGPLSCAVAGARDDAGDEGSAQGDGGGANDAGGTWGAGATPHASGGGGSGTGSTTTSQSSTHSEGPKCDGLFTDPCGACLESFCCNELAACGATAGCIDCVAGNVDPGCYGAQPAAGALYDCADAHCAADCIVSGADCTGNASTSGDIDGYQPNASVGTVQPDPSGNIQVILFEGATIDDGELVVGVYFFAQPGQLSYPPNGSVGCALFQYDGDFVVIDATQLCEVNLSVLEFASAPGVCDGFISGTFDGIFSQSQPLAGAFSLPMSIHESEVSPPPCQPTDGPCSSNGDCCSQSCSMYLGLCN